ncbi:amidohydrolase family protein [Celeribacter indicus]|uniref:4-oxalomesaconate hydratase n=1 Tax=Celeribacter indicus TaxID=1208324 RepID=A0A0B5E800_9RHOB|nr:amidohydrolase family protein [Celeribacter indicus]AJE48432.1 4-oxalomesaconate hydratase [Celeribacter indicus]SDX29490.1 aminocarboxymuconate-semialdehyde decarboxylase [Celeribacter indicus]
MRYIDAFNHFFPKPLWDKMQTSEGTIRDIGQRMRGIPAIYDLEERFRVMDQFDDYTQILSLGMPPLESLGAPAETEEYARLANDGMADLVDRHPDRFAGFIASLPMNSPNAAVEAERAFTDLGANGLQIHTNVNGRALDNDEYFAVFEMAERHGKPVLLHPSRGSNMPDYIDEEKSKYEIWWTFGWPYETSAAMARLVFSGMMDRLPDLKVLGHHLGAMVPYFEGRVGPGMDQLGKRTTDEDLSLVLKSLKKRPLDYFKDFYADTAVFGSRAATLCGLEFYGEDKVLFASDSPFDPERGPGYIRDTIKVLESIEMSPEAREKISYRNAQDFFGLKKD